MACGTQAARYRLLRVALFMMLLFCIACPALADEVIWPSQEGSRVLARGVLTLDASHANDGYISARVEGGAEAIWKLLIRKDSMTYQYDLRSDGKYEVFPLQMGSGGYSVSLYRHVSGKTFEELSTIWLDAQLREEDIYRLSPNQYVWFEPDMEMITTLNMQCAGMTEQEVFKAVRSVLRGDYVYDFISAYKKDALVPSDVVRVFERKMGTCVELATLTVALLRSQGVRSALVIGHADGQYHAWVEATIDGATGVYDPSADLCHYRIQVFEPDRYY